MLRCAPADLASRLLAVGLALLLCACATKPPPHVAATPTCPPGQHLQRTAQLFFGRAAPAVQLSAADFRKFVDEELRPRFPDGLTVLDGGEKWRGPENKLLRESAKVALIVLPPAGDPSPKIEAVRAAYRTRFHQDSVLLITQAACVSF